jgi:pilus assembly protein TadC
VTVGVLALGWAFILAAPLAVRAQRSGIRARVASLREGARPRGAIAARRLLLRARLPAHVERLIEAVRARRRARLVDDAVARDLPVTIDLLAVAVGAGCTPFLAVDAAAQWAPPALGARLAGVRRACALGRSFATALDDLATEIPRLRPLTDALLASDRFGAPVGDALARLAAEQRTVLRRRAEARARTVPVRLLFPLVFLVLPAFALLTVVPAVFAGLGAT